MNMGTRSTGIVCRDLELYALVDYSIDGLDSGFAIRDLILEI